MLNIPQTRYTRDTLRALVGRGYHAHMTEHGTLVSAVMCVGDNGSGARMPCGYLTANLGAPTTCQCGGSLMEYGLYAHELAALLGRLD